MNQVDSARMARPEGEIIPVDMAIRSLRDSGYRNTACALAELIDNSVQANAKNVEVICIEEHYNTNGRSARKVQAIGVLDDGDGMPPETLRLALQFGNGTHLTDRKGMGRFGMGLPNSSISQCRRVEVWTWQAGPDNAIYTYLDIDKIEGGVMVVVPPPEPRRLPDEWHARSSNLGPEGTFVLWTNFEDNRLSWRRATTIMDKTELLIGRMYRKFIDDGRVSIRYLPCSTAKTIRLSTRMFVSTIRFT